MTLTANEITTHEAAKILDRKVRWVRRLCACGKLRARKVGRDWILDRRSVIHLRDHRVKPGRPRNKKN